MEINAYQFGRISVDERSYTTDVIITPEGVRDNWWRKEGHRLGVDDLTEVVAAKPDCLIVGTGYYGRMAIPDETRRYLAEHDIELKEATTREAVAEFNRLQRDMARVVAALHLTC